MSRLIVNNIPGLPHVWKWSVKHVCDGVRREHFTGSRLKFLNIACLAVGDLCSLLKLWCGGALNLDHAPVEGLPLSMSSIGCVYRASSLGLCSGLSAKVPPVYIINDAGPSTLQAIPRSPQVDKGSRRFLCNHTAATETSPTLDASVCIFDVKAFCRCVEVMRSQYGPNDIFNLL